MLLKSPSLHEYIWYIYIYIYIYIYSDCHFTEEGHLLQRVLLGVHMWLLMPSISLQGPLAYLTNELAVFSIDIAFIPIHILQTHILCLRIDMCFGCCLLKDFCKATLWENSIMRFHMTSKSSFRQIDPTAGRYHIFRLCTNTHRHYIYIYIYIYIMSKNPLKEYFYDFFLFIMWWLSEKVGFSSEVTSWNRFIIAKWQSIEFFFLLYKDAKKFPKNKVFLFVLYYQINVIFYINFFSWSENFISLISTHFYLMKIWAWNNFF